MLSIEKARAIARQQTARRRAARQQWQASFTQDPIPLAHLPKPIVIRARQILAALEAGTPPGELRGRRFSFDRTLLRIPVAYRYRFSNEIRSRHKFASA